MGKEFLQFNAIYTLDGRDRTIKVKKALLNISINIFLERYSSSMHPMFDFPLDKMGRGVIYMDGESIEVQYKMSGYFNAFSTNPSSLVKLCTRDLDLPDAVVCRYGNSGDEPEGITPEIRKLIEDKADLIGTSRILF